MSRKKWVLYGMAAILILAISISVVSANSSFNILNFKKMDGNKQVQEGVIVDLPTVKDKQKVVDSIDPKTGAPVLQLEPKANNRNILTKHFVIEDTDKTLDAPYVKENNKDVLIYDPVLTLSTVPIPGTKEYLISYDGTIYITDWDNNKLKKFLKDEVNGYKKDEVLSRSFDYVGTPLWGVSPSVNPSGTYILFYTDRSMINGNMNGEMWIKNMITGDERPVLEVGAAVIGWIDNTTVILAGTQIVSLNVETGDIKAFIENPATNVAIVKDQLVYQKERGSLTFISINTGEVTTVSSSLIYRCSFQTRGSWVAMLNQVRAGDGEFSVVLYNVDSKIWKEITAPTNTWIDGVSWMDDNTLLIKTSIKGTTDEATYIVNIDDVEVVQ